MAKANYKANPQDVERAKENNIPLSTFYRRLSMGWDSKRASTEKPRKTGNIQRADNGEVLPSGLGRSRLIRLPADLDSAVDQLITDSGLTAIEYFRQILEPELLKRSRGDR